MKNLALVSLVLFFLFSNTTSTFAHGNIGAGNIEYEWLKDSTYRVYFKHVRRCHPNNAAPANITLCIFNSCSNSTTTAQMPMVTGNIKDNNFINGYALGLTCLANGTKCTGGSLIDGMREYWYATTITLPQRCTNWRFSVNDDVRGHINNINSNSSTNTYFHIEANLYTNNINNPQPNTSPYFLSSSHMQIPHSQATIYNLGAVDIDGDSLSYSVINTKSNKHCDSTPTNAVYATQIPSIQIPNNPLQCNNTFTIDNLTGTAKFTVTPPTSGSSESVVTFLIEEYRNGILIGDVVRDVQFSPLPSTITPPTLTHDPNSLSGATFSNNRLSGCIDKQMSMCFDIKHNDPNTRFILSDNHQAIIPGSQILYYNNTSDSVRGCLGWKPSLASVGLHTMIIDILDTSCIGGSAGILFNRQAVFEVFIAPPVETDKDMIVCVNEPVQLTASGGWGIYNWQVLSGTPNSLSCTNCATPVATPAVKTTYRVSSTNGICAGDNHYADTIVLDVHNAVPTNPTISITASPSAVVNAGTQVTFTANTTACNNPNYLWFNKSTALAGATTSTYTSQLLEDQDRISCRLSCADTCPKPRVQVSNIITMQIANSVAVVKRKSNTKIYPNPNNGNFTIETEIDVKQQQTTIEVMNTFGQVVFVGDLKTQKQQVNLQELSAGMYFLKIISQTETQAIQFMMR